MPCSLVSVTELLVHRASCLSLEDLTEDGFSSLWGDESQFCLPLRVYLDRVVGRDCDYRYFGGDAPSGFE